jgi:RNA polymerase sigma-70 factor (ECF subfamily)
VLLGELYTSVDTAKAAEHFRKALALAQTQADKQTIRRKLDAL